MTGGDAVATGTARCDADAAAVASKRAIDPFRRRLA